MQALVSQRRYIGSRCVGRRVCGCGCVGRQTDKQSVALRWRGTAYPADSCLAGWVGRMLRCQR